MSVYRAALTAIAVLLVVSCASHNAKYYDENTDVFVASSVLKPDEIKISTEPKNAPYNFIYLKYSLHSTSDRVRNEQTDLIRWALGKIGVKPIVGDEEINRLVISNNLTPFVTSKSDILSLHNLTKAVGPFLVLEVYTDYLWYPERSVFGIKVSDPVSGVVLFHAKRAGIVWLSVEKELYNPVFNALEEWYKKYFTANGGQGI